MKKLSSLLPIIICSILLLTGFASCPLTIEQPPKVEVFVTSVEDSGPQEFEYINVTTGEHLFISCIYDDQRDDLPARTVPMEMCNNVKGTTFEQAGQLEDYCLDQATRLAICKKHPCESANDGGNSL